MCKIVHLQVLGNRIALIKCDKLGHFDSQIQIIRKLSIDVPDYFKIPSVSSHIKFSHTIPHTHTLLSRCHSLHDIASLFAK